MLSNSNQRKIGIVLQYLQMMLNIVISLAYTPIMLRILGQNEYGIFNLASSSIAYLNILSLGFGASYIRFYSKCKKENNDDRLKKLNGLYLTTFSIMGIIALIVGLVLSFNANLFFNNTYSPENIETAKVLMLFLSINLALSFPFSVFASYVTSQEKFVFQKLLNMGKSLLAPALNIVALYLGYGSIGMVLSSTIIIIVVDLINVYYCLAKLKMKISFNNMEWHLLKPIFMFSIFIAINQIIDQINWQTDKIILGKMINGGAVAIYAVGANINTMYISFSTAISGVFAPKIHKIENSNIDEKNKTAELNNLFISVGRIQFFVLGLILTGFIFFGRFFILKWAGEDYSNSYYIVLLLICPVTIPLIQNIGIEIQRAKNKHQFRSVVYLIMALLNVGISIWFAYMWGEIGVALGTTISLLVANGLIMNVYYYKKLCINTIEFWKSIISTLPGLTIPVAGGVCLMLFYSFNSLLDFCLLIVAYTIIYVLSVYFLSFNKAEKNAVNVVLKRVFKIK